MQKNLRRSKAQSLKWARSFVPLKRLKKYRMQKARLLVASSLSKDYLQIKLIWRLRGKVGKFSNSLSQFSNSLSRSHFQIKCIQLLWWRQTIATNRSRWNNSKLHKEALSKFHNSCLRVALLLTSKTPIISPICAVWHIWRRKLRCLKSLCRLCLQLEGAMKWSLGKQNG